MILETLCGSVTKIFWVDLEDWSEWSFNSINIELLSVFSRFHTQIKRVSKIACFDSSTSFCEAITLYTMKTWALGGVWGLIKNMKNF